MNEDRTEPVQVRTIVAEPHGRPAGYPVAEAVLRYQRRSDGWRGVLTEISPAAALLETAYVVAFRDGREARVRVTALSPIDRRRAYYVGEGDWPG
ncbi:MAG TPA: hypothetical protein VKV26_11865 [Dehalococcoidia bacterium]|nr:hypothetical protein [Dehalococcoidia bacterium]